MRCYKCHVIGIYNVISFFIESNNAQLHIFASHLSSVVICLSTSGSFLHIFRELLFTVLMQFVHLVLKMKTFTQRILYFKELVGFVLSTCKLKVHMHLFLSFALYSKGLWSMLVNR